MKHYWVLFLLFLTISGNCQKPEYLILFEGIGDNREFFTEKIPVPAKTILGTRIVFEFGTTIEEHILRIGLSELYEFGSRISFHEPKLTLYYKFQKRNNEFYFGSFPRKELINFPLAMLADTLLYFRPNIEGIYGKTKWNWGHQLFFLDWTSKQTENERENFIIGSSGRLRFKNLFIENYFIIYHDEGSLISKTTEHLKDYMGYLFQPGLILFNKENLYFDIKAGILGSLFRERHVTDGFINTSSIFFESLFRINNFSIQTFTHSGDGHRFPMGDPFYKLNNYYRINLNWNFLNHKNISTRINLSLHLLDWYELENSQQFSIIYKIP